MNKAEIIKGINMAIEGLETLRNAINDEDNAEAKTTAPAKTVTKPATKAVAKTPVKKEADTEATGDGQTFTTAELSGMKYNEFKKLASSLGVDCKGTRDEIMARVVALGVVTDADAEAGAEEAPVKKEDKKPVGKSNKSASVGKIGAKKADTASKDEFDEKAEEIAKSTPVEDIISALKDVDVKANKLNYKTQLAKALREGLLSVGDDDEEAGGDDEATGEEMTAESYFEQYDLSGANSPDTMSEERATACAEKQEAILNAVAEGELTSDDIIDFLQNNAEQEELDLLGDEYDENDLVQLYIEVSKHFIDDEGEEHEPGEAYTIGETPFCCGQPLAYDESTSKFLCSHCAGEYEAE